MSEPATFTEEDRARIEWQIHKLRFDSTQPGIPEIQEQWLKDAEVLTRALAYIEELETQTTRAEGLMWQAAGLGAIAVMKDAPDVVMPTEIIEEGMQAILAEHRHPTTEAHDDE